MTYIKNWANGKQRPHAELALLENYSHFSSTLSSKNNRTYSKIWVKEQVWLYSRDYATGHNENEDENEKGSHRYSINRPRSDMDASIVNINSVSV